jgi:hypothetical protein
MVNVVGFNRIGSKYVVVKLITKTDLSFMLFPFFLYISYLSYKITVLRTKVIFLNLEWLTLKDKLKYKVLQLKLPHSLQYHHGINPRINDDFDSTL